MSRPGRITLALTLVAMVPLLAIPAFFAGVGIGLIALLFPLAADALLVPRRP
jgi:hypothetical protein